MDYASEHIPTAHWTVLDSVFRPVGDFLSDALMRPGMVEISHIFLHHLVQVALTQDQHSIETFLPSRANPALRNRIRLR